MVREDPPGSRERHLLPDVFRFADRASVAGQRRAIRWYTGQVTMLLLASAVAIPDVRARGLDLSPVFSLLAFAGAYYFWERLREERPQRQWYEGRAAAEAMKSLVWKYAMRARPFDGRADDPAADGEFRARMDELLRAFRDSGAVPESAKPAITEEMRRRRSAPLTVRRDMYLNERVRGQRTWYLDRAQGCESESVKWSMISIAAIILGGVFAVLQILEVIPWHVLGTFTTIGASVAAWTQLKQYAPLASAYRMAASELDGLDVQLSRLDLRRPEAEEDWSRLAWEAEETVSRENGVWRARRDRGI